MARRVFVIFLVVVGLTAVIAVGPTGFEDYLSPLVDRPFRPDYSFMSPSGNCSHGLGIIGATMITVGVMTNSSRKRIRALWNLGKISSWLEFHIFLCLVGPVLVVGGGDSAVEAAVGIASQPGNSVTISYRWEGFVRLKEKNEQKINSLMASKNINVIFNSNVAEIKSQSVVLTLQDGKKQEIPNDNVFIFAGGELPTELLKKVGVRLRENEVDAKAA